MYRVIDPNTLLSHFYPVGLADAKVAFTALGQSSTLAVNGPEHAAGPSLMATNNPGRGRIVFRIANPLGGPSRLTVFDIAGRRISTPFEGMIKGQEATVEWAGVDDRGVRVAGGVYLCRLEAAGKTRLSRVCLLR